MPTPSMPCSLTTNPTSLLEGVRPPMDLLQLLRRDLGVDDRSPDMLVPEEGLDVPEPSSSVEEGGR